MFKTTILFLSALVSFSVLAGPKVGDSASYVGTLNGAPAAMTTTITSFNPATSKFVVTSRAVVAGQAQTEVEEQDPTEIMSDEETGQILENCSSFGGVLETITVVAGTFNTCKMQGNLNFGMVPFGLVRGTDLATDQGMLTLELSAFTRGQ